MTTQNVLKQIVKETIAPLFKAAGFKKQGNNFAQVCSDFSATVNIQSSKWNTQDEAEFFFNTGIYIEELFGTVHLYPKSTFPMEIDSVLRIRGTELTKNDSWYSLTTDTNVEQLKRMIMKDITEYILPHLRQFESINDVIRVMELREKDGVYDNPHHLTVLYCSIGDLEKARARMARVYNELKLDSQKEFAIGLANRLGLRV
ncbi:DUF4304 domain-containing protein [Paenibacillus radicis (ex Gao et al. 2016)]|uniref:DUF4304 domain-containing protein n=1 Tax=Paenibacillus radicis (ex Gao et al. 2016) TaxID=1737354 RepID=A0A917GWZ2_9BACL|nr:DUF4304 domain-containing protein [Paenibacillus radicis (ex Gao et al. 2016)]GGG59370.1 hypothetical protein GCM10010918_10690 [Paenibacillus radicis (ex Gao et al. 2016)]